MLVKKGALLGDLTRLDFIRKTFYLCLTAIDQMPLHKGFHITNAVMGYKICHQQCAPRSQHLEHQIGETLCHRLGKVVIILPRRLDKIKIGIGFLQALKAI
jgi:hypothetical protein